MTKAPCTNCPDRAIGCHGKCDKYREWKAKLEEENKKRLEDMQTLEAILYDKKRNRRARKRK